MSLINNTKFFIKDEVLTSKYTVYLMADGSATGTYYLTIRLDRGQGQGVEEVACVSYTNMIINGIDPNKIIISSPEIYAELTANNCENVDYTFITTALR